MQWANVEYKEQLVDDAVELVGPYLHQIVQEVEADFYEQPGTASSSSSAGPDWRDDPSAGGTLSLLGGLHRTMLRLIHMHDVELPRIAAAGGTAPQYFTDLIHDAYEVVRGDPSHSEYQRREAIFKEYQRDVLERFYSGVMLWSMNDYYEDTVPRDCKCPRRAEAHYPCKAELNAWTATCNKAMRIAGQYQRWLCTTWWAAFVYTGECRCHCDVAVLTPEYSRSGQRVPRTPRRVADWASHAWMRLFFASGSGQTDKEPLSMLCDAPTKFTMGDMLAQLPYFVLTHYAQASCMKANWWADSVRLPAAGGRPSTQRPSAKEVAEVASAQSTSQHDSDDEDQPTGSGEARTVSSSGAEREREAERVDSEDELRQAIEEAVGPAKNKRKRA